jgi:hypothetical protein
MRNLLQYLADRVCRRRVIADRADKSREYLVRNYLWGSPTSWSFCAIHRIRKSDSDLHLHSHPFHYLALQLAGTMYEVQPDGVHKRRAGYLRLRSRASLHRLILPHGEVFSLFIGFGRSGSWGFKVGRRIVDFKEYLGGNG